MKRATILIVLTLFALSGCKKKSPSSESGSSNDQKQQQKDQKNKQDESADEDEDAPSGESSGVATQDDAILESMNEAADHVD